MDCLTHLIHFCAQLSKLCHGDVARIISVDCLFLYDWDKFEETLFTGHLKCNLCLIYATLPLCLHVLVEGLRLLGVRRERLPLDLPGLVRHPLQLRHLPVIWFHTCALKHLRGIWLFIVQLIF